MFLRLDLRSRRPAWNEAVSVYSVIVVILYTWTLLSFFRQLGAWSKFMLAGELLAVSAYLFAANFLESIVFFAGILFIGMILPRRWFLEKFMYRGALLSILVLGYLMYFVTRFTTWDKYPAYAVKALPYILPGIFLSAYLLDYVPYLRRAVELLAERTIIFLYLYIPVSMISLLFILVWNIF